ncbi:hypothetical protein S40293_09089 [Stachybotrys chartarum IBT 40293]|nr:hypothetical protein S40293_09089 [Stachybotrys chartarum IBT 40293]
MIPRPPSRDELDSEPRDRRLGSTFEADQEMVDVQQGLNEDNDNTEGSSVAQEPIQRLSVRCDRRRQCARCLRSGSKCTYTAQVKVRPKRSQVQAPSHIDAKIDGIAQKLDALCELLQTGRSISKVSSTSDVCEHVTPRHATSRTHPENPQVQTECSKSLEPEYEGGSALSTHTAFATRFLHSAVVRDHSLNIIPDNDSKLGELYREIGDLFNTPRPVSGPLMTTGESPYQARPPAPQMPPPDMVLNCLRIARVCGRVASRAEYFFKVYSSSIHTAAEQIIVLYGLYALLLECASVLTNPEQKAAHKAQAQVCRDGLESVIAGLSFHLPSNYDYTLALSLAAGYSAERMKPTVAWNLNCAAARMAQALGYHKIVNRGSEMTVTTRRHVRIFGSIYMADKILSLRLGRGSVIREDEMASNYDATFDQANSAPQKFPPYWIALARLHGCIYDRLYSPRALCQSPQDRSVQARELLKDHQVILAQSYEAMSAFGQEFSNAMDARINELFQLIDSGFSMTMECLIYRSIPVAEGSTLPFCDECIPLAREAMDKHRRCVSLLPRSESWFVAKYFNWAMLTFPFVPFIIILCHVVETLDMADFDLLGGLISAIEGIRELLPEVYTQLGRFRPLYEVVGKFIEAKMAPMREMQAFDDFLQEANIDFSFEPSFLSMLTDRREPEGTGGQERDGASILNFWTNVDPETEGTGL